MKSCNLITPEGTRDLLFEECVAVKREEKKLRELFSSRGYHEVITPALEFYDVFTLKERGYKQEDLYKLTDSKGRLMVMRPDVTLPIVRIAATRMRGGVFPLKLFYSQNIYRCNPKDAGRDDEITQSGIEIIGGDEKRSDLEALCLAAEALSSCGGTNARLEIGDNTFYKYLIRTLEVEDDETLGVNVTSKNIPALKEYLKNNVKGDTEEKKKAADILVKLPSLFGGAEVFEKAEALFSGTPAAVRLSELKDTYETLLKLESRDKITVDLAFANKADYYTGIIFRGYIEEYGQAVISGGRYDGLVAGFGGGDLPAVGFAANINAMAAASIKKDNGSLKTVTDVLVYADDEHITDGIRHCKKLCEDKLTAEFCSCADYDEALSYARSMNIKRIDAVSGESDNDIKIIAI